MRLLSFFDGLLESCDAVFLGLGRGNDVRQTPTLFRLVPMMKNRPFVIALMASVVVLAGCAQSSGVLQLGPDTYTVSVHAAPVRGGESGARKIALNEAGQQCRSMSREIFVTKITSGPSSHFPGGTVEVTFRCLYPSDPGLHRPVYESAPDAVIQHKY